MIEIKSTFSDWHEVSKEQAKEYVKFLLQNMNAIKKTEQAEYINKNKLRGITVEELLKEN